MPRRVDVQKLLMPFSGRSIGERSVREHPGSAKAASGFGVTLQWLASLKVDQDRSVASETIRQALAHQKRALTIDPGNAGFCTRLINHLIVLRRVAPAQGVRPRPSTRRGS